MAILIQCIPVVERKYCFTAKVDYNFNRRAPFDIITIWSVSSVLCSSTVLLSINTNNNVKHIVHGALRKFKIMQSRNKSSISPKSWPS